MGVVTNPECGLPRCRWAPGHPLLAAYYVRETRLEAFAVDPAGDGSPVALAVTTGPTEIRIIDRYPTSPLGMTRECLPPDGEHGDFWHYEERLRMVLTVPRGVRVSASTMSGSVTGH